MSSISEDISRLYGSEVAAHKETSRILKRLVAALDDWNPRNADPVAAKAYHAAREHLGLKRGDKVK